MPLQVLVLARLPVGWTPDPIAAAGVLALSHAGNRPRPPGMPARIFDLLAASPDVFRAVALSMIRTWRRSQEELRAQVRRTRPEDEPMMGTTGSRRSIAAAPCPVRSAP